jgi:phage pi2 protein 07
MFMEDNGGIVFYLDNNANLFSFKFKDGSWIFYILLYFKIYFIYFSYINVDVIITVISINVV